MRALVTTLVAAAILTTAATVTASGAGASCPKTVCGENSPTLSGHLFSTATVGMDGFGGALRIIVTHGASTVADQSFNAYTATSTSCGAQHACGASTISCAMTGSGAQCFESAAFVGSVFCGRWTDSDTWTSTVKWCP